jgi:PAS domain S-box-containing protein
MAGQVLKPRARAFLAGVIVLGAAAVVASVMAGGSWALRHPVAFTAMVLGMVAAEALVFTFNFRRESWSFSIVEVAITFGLLTMPPEPLVMAGAVGLGVAQLLRRRPLLKAAFNVGMYSLAIVAAGMIFALLTSRGLGGPHNWLAAGLAMVVFYLINQTLLSFVVSLVSDQPVGDVLRIGAPMVVAVWGGGVVLGMLAGHLVFSQPEVLWLLAIPILLSYVAYRGWIRSKEDSRRTHELYRAGSTLVAGLDYRGSLVEFLNAIREMFRASTTEVVKLEGPDAFQVTRNDGSEMVIPFAELGPALTPSAALEAYVASTSWDTHMVARLASEIGITGALIAVDHTPPGGGVSEFPNGDAELLQHLANQLSIRLRDLALFESVNEEREKLADIVENTSDGIYQVDPERRIVTWNPAMETLTGYSAAEAIGQMCFTILRARDGRGVDMCSTSCPIHAAAENGCQQHREAQIMTRDGAARWIEYSHSPIIDASGKMTSDVIVVRDVTTQRAAREAKDDFVATVSHELRTPLTPIKGFLLTLMRSDVNISEKERLSFYDRMLRNTERLENLVEDLLDVSRIEADQLSLTLTTVDVTSIVKQVIDNYQAQYADRTFRLVSGAPISLAHAHEGRLEQVLANLVQNAIRYSPEGESIDVTLREDTSWVIISVRDRGPGIPYDEQEKIFDRFYRVGHHLTREPGGTGLGLFIARRLSQAMEGRLTVSSRLGQGATFSIHLRSTLAPAASSVTA